MKVSRVKQGRVVVTLEARDEIEWLRASLVSVRAGGVWSQLLAELAEASVRAMSAIRVTGMTITLETSDEIQQLKAGLARVRQQLADDLIATIATVAAWGPVTHRWVTPPHIHPPR